MTSSFVLALDPSGSFYEGKGTTGWCILDTQTKQLLACGSLFAKNYTSAEQYWDANLQLIAESAQHYPKLMVVCEDYLLYANKLTTQINSRMETPKLLGCVQWFCYTHQIPYYMQLASEVKHRWANSVLEHKGYIYPYRRGYRPNCPLQETFTHHTIDAIRHAVHYVYFRWEKTHVY